MDPNACWELLVDAVAFDDMEAAKEAADNLQTWLNKGGFKPNDFDAELFEQVLYASV